MSAKLRKTLAANQKYRTSSMPSKMIQLYLATLPVPPGGIQKISWGMLLEELSIPLPWLRVALRELQESGALPMAGLFTFLPKGVERINNPNMVTSAIRRIAKLDYSSGPIPLGIWEQAIAYAEKLLPEKPYLQAYLDFCHERRILAPESVDDWDAAMGWEEQDSWAEVLGSLREAQDAPQEQGITREQVIELVESILQATLPAVMEPLLALLRQALANPVAANPGVASETTMATPSSFVQQPSPRPAAAPTTSPSPRSAPEPARRTSSGKVFGRRTPTETDWQPEAQSSQPDSGIFFPVQRDNKGDRFPLKASLIENLSAQYPALDILQELQVMIHYLEHKCPQKIPLRAKAVKYIHAWMKRKSEQCDGLREIPEAATENTGREDSAKEAVPASREAPAPAVQTVVQRTTQTDSVSQLATPSGVTPLPAGSASPAATQAAGMVQQAEIPVTPVVVAQQGQETGPETPEANVSAKPEVAVQEAVAAPATEEMDWLWYADHAPDDREEAMPSLESLGVVGEEENAVQEAAAVAEDPGDDPQPEAEKPAPEPVEPEQKVAAVAGYRAKPKKKQDLSELTESFIAFWEAYPRKEARKVALQFWHRKGCEKYLQEILEDIEWKKKNRWNDPKYIPLPGTYLSQERWTDMKALDNFANEKQNSDDPEEAASWRDLMEEANKITRERKWKKDLLDKMGRREISVEEYHAMLKRGFDYYDAIDITDITVVSNREKPLALISN